MKGIPYLIISAILTLSSCNSFEEPTPDIPTQQEDNAIRSLSEIETIANHVHDMMSTQLKGRSSSDRISEILPIFSSRSTSRSSDDALLYAVNYENNGGFVIVSSPKDAEPVIGFSDEGNINNIDSESNFAFYLDMACDYVKSRKAIIEPSDSGKVIIPFIRRDSVFTNTFVKPRVKLNLGQRWPEHTYCTENYLAGCGPVAIAMAMSYKKQPTQLALTFQGRPQNNIQLDWNDLCKHINTGVINQDEGNAIKNHYDQCEATQGAHTTLACLIRQLGILSDVTYSNSPWITYTTLPKIYDTLKATGVSSRIFYYEGYREIFEKIETGGIALIEGHQTNSPEDFGHVWIIDGWARMKCVIEYSTLGGMVTKTDEVYDKKYLHNNWGEHGNYNGYFFEGIFKQDASTITPGGSNWKELSRGDLYTRPNYCYKNNFILIY